VGVNGFRAWTADKPPPGFVLCPCGYAGLKHYAFKDHVAAYRENPQSYKRSAKYQERRGELEPEELAYQRTQLHKTVS
jgi:hypothetical protein